MTYNNTDHLKFRKQPASTPKAHQLKLKPPDLKQFLKGIEHLQQREQPLLPLLSERTKRGRRIKSILLQVELTRHMKSL